jgi:PST family polysaccharide transporter
MIWGMVTAVVAVGAFAAGFPWKAFGVAVIYATSEYMKTIPLWLHVCRRGPVRTIDILRGLGPLVFAAHVALGAMWFVHDRLNLCDAAATLALSYFVFKVGAAAFPSGRQALREAVRLVKDFNPLRQNRTTPTRRGAG